jgi:UDP-N-acetylmuramoylalanine--D-glutamate ligase
LPKISAYNSVSLENPTGEILNYIDDSSRNLKGIHNLYNIATTLEVLNILNIDTKLAAEFIKTYSGLEHRIEYVRNIKDVDYINDSKSTSPDATRVALETFGEHKNIILIAGGTDKNVSFDSLKDPLNQYVKSLIILDHDINDKLKKLADGFNIASIIATNMKEAINIAFEKATPRDTVLLSPAAASLGKYKNFEERGQVFKEIVNSL